MSEYIKMLKTLKAGRTTYPKGMVLKPPFPSSLSINKEISRGALIFINIKDKENAPQKKFGDADKKDEVQIGPPKKKATLKLKRRGTNDGS